MELNQQIIDLMRGLGIDGGAIHQSLSPDCREIRLPGYENAISDMFRLEPVIDALKQLGLSILGYGAGQPFMQDDFIGATITVKV
ncbi:hypothetical protein [Croceicoccus gelatinilyticus]|uniref:hypothetical protein n=1 Tax=Croceicoccus gelatinilyticus TaxID=2835536 RepID=UPI001BCC525D|nr:hypothetical protein [Croceicoccus gelatinilyticus]MBS7671502.1 hypothetical protein [Croceicoccus gelatinilyticus]